VQAAGGPHVLILLVLLFILGQAMLLVANWWLSQWYGGRLHANIAPACVVWRFGMLGITLQIAN
jgi:hypothetical protein